MAITDHADYSNIEHIINSLHRAAPKLKEYYGIEVIVGVELTYIPPDDIENMVEAARNLRAELVIVHGETSAEDVPPGTNLAGVKAKSDILAHPGNLTDEVAQIAIQNNVYIELTTRGGHRDELTTRGGHRDTNKGVAEIAVRNGCNLILNTDSHEPEDLLDKDKIAGVLMQSGLKSDYYEVLRGNSLSLIETIKERRR
jgi:histidinol phosphatase-like PHP family hydrolase